MAKKALVIGVSNYTDTDFVALPAATRDAKAMQQVLIHPDIGGFEDVKCLEDPERQNMAEEIEGLFADCQRNDLVLLFFSGHGKPDSEGHLYLTSRNTNKNRLRSTAIDAGFVQQAINNCRAKRKVIILDCCYSGAFAKGWSAKDDGSVNLKNQLGGEGQAVLTSSTSTQYSFAQTGSDLSIYTQYLVEGLTTGDADLGRDGFGFISLGELHEYAQRKVQEVKPEMKPEIYPGKEGYTIRLAKTPSTDPIVRYRDAVSQYAYVRSIWFARRTVLDGIQDWLNMPPRDDVRMSSTVRKTLDARYQNLGLSAEMAKKIEDQALSGYRLFHKNLESYEQEFVRKLRQENPLGTAALQELRELQQAKGISNEHALAVQHQIFQRMQCFPYLSVHRFKKFLNPQTIRLLLGSGFLVIFAIGSFNFIQEDRQKNRPSITPTDLPSVSPLPPIVNPSPTEFPSPQPTSTSQVLRTNVTN
jgi:branched-chain amino acid transport system substrate-binding protein